MYYYDTERDFLLEDGMPDCDIEPRDIAYASIEDAINGMAASRVAESDGPEWDENRPEAALIQPAPGGSPLLVERTKAMGKEFYVIATPEGDPRYGIGLEIRDWLTSIGAIYDQLRYRWMAWTWSELAPYAI